MDDSQSQKTLSRKAFWLVIGFSFLIFFAQTRSFKLLVDGLTYTAISKNILSTGDWLTLHYSGGGYTDFTQQMPLAFWIQALIFKFFGFSEPICRVFSSACCVLSAGIVFKFAKKFYGLAAAVWGGVALFTTTRYIKWGTNFYLDAILGFFILAGVCSWLFAAAEETKASGKELFLSFFSGVFLFSAFMTKGVIALGAMAIVPASLVFFFSRKNILKVFIFALGILVPTAIWFHYGNGLEYLKTYFLTGASGRAQAEFSIHPWRNIYKLWLPWWPAYAFALVWFLKNLWKRNFSTEFKVTGVLIAASLSFPLGFSLGRVYYEHYLTPFYPLASILVGMQLMKTRWFSKVTERGISIGYGFLLVAALFVATVAPSFHVVQDLAPMQWVYEIQRLPLGEQRKIKNIAFTDQATNIWYGLANILGKTDFNAEGSFNLSRAAMSDTILITSRDEVPNSSWKNVPCFYVDGFRAYVSKDFSICERQ